MGKELVTKSEFARLAGVNPSTVTKVCRTQLLDAFDGKRIDAAHPAAVAYLKNKRQHQTLPAATGLDPLYQNAVDFCKKNRRYSVNALQREFRIGFDRGKIMIETMRAAGIIPDGHNPLVQIPEQPSPKLRGNAAVNHNKKSLALVEANIRINTEENRYRVHEVPENIQAFAHMTLTEIIERYGTDTAFVDWLKATKAIEDIHEKRLKNAEKAGELVSRQLVKVGIIDTIDGAFNRMLTDGAKTIALRTKAIMDSGGKLQDIEDLVAKQLGTFIRPTKSKIVRVLKNA